MAEASSTSCCSQSNRFDFCPALSPVFSSRPLEEDGQPPVLEFLRPCWRSCGGRTLGQTSCPLRVRKGMRWGQVQSPQVSTLAEGGIHRQGSWPWQQDPLISPERKRTVSRWDSDMALPLSASASLSPAENSAAGGSGAPALPGDPRKTE